ncbi:MAG: hypothetical protein M3362_05100 [Acidobacteriota bacterium]|nr:hypothetical protein [Acidobacteriota bacterium]
MKLGDVDYSEFIRAIEGNISFFTDEMRSDNVYLRHDVDDRIDCAVQMAELEAELGVASTYFMLDTADYFYRSFDKMRYIQSLGHEVGWHNNAITRVLKSNADMDSDLTPKIRSCVEEVVGVMTANGLNLKGTASHGDPVCYVFNYTNYGIWDCFKKKDNLPYTQLKLEDFGLQYEAYKFNFGWYLSDSGGKWNAEPFEYIHKWNEAKNKPIQILVHSQWWK